MSSGAQVGLVALCSQAPSREALLRALSRTDILRLNAVCRGLTLPVPPLPPVASQFDVDFPRLYWP